MEQSGRATSIASSLMLLACGLAAFAVDGIAISQYADHPEWPPGTWGSEIYRHIIKDNKVAEKKLIFSGKGRFPVINMEGSHVAFVNVDDSGKHIAVMTIDGQNVTYMADLTGSEKTCVDWPAGDWVYYIDTPSDLWKVNYKDPSQKEKVLTFSGPGIWMYSMSADAKRVHVTFEGTGRSCAELPFDGNLPSMGWGGCGSSISPSGIYLASLSDAGHSNYTNVNWSLDDPNDGQVDKDKIARGVNTNQKQWNAWHENDPEICCNGVCVGIGATHPRWSRNSDKWYILDLGWRHRFAGCGRNQILVNWQDSISINVTRNPRSCSELEGEGCANFEKDNFEQNYAGDFLVQAPIDDVNEDLRKYLDASYAASRSRLHENSESQILLESNRATFRVNVAANATVKLCNAKGKAIAYKREIADGQAVITSHRLPAGIYFVQAINEGQAFSERVIVR